MVPSQGSWRPRPTRRRPTSDLDAGGGAADRAPGYVPAVTGSGAAGATAGSSRGAARVGCSGWDYPDWRGVVYPADLPRRRWFEHYATRFDTVELNSTFYRLPTPTTVERW